ncbi:hypothetical protein J6590_078208 [Homalodisca vitripennis]|nr:hypothetical protein J6590_078208 [Homalodisca vitripennis]
MDGALFEMDGINTTFSHSPLNEYSFHTCTQRPWWFTIASYYYSVLSGAVFEMDGINTTFSHSPRNEYSFHTCTQRPWWFTIASYYYSVL